MYIIISFIIKVLYSPSHPILHLRPILLSLLLFSFPLRRSKTKIPCHPRPPRCQSVTNRCKHWVGVSVPSGGRARGVRLPATCVRGAGDAPPEPRAWEGGRRERPSPACVSWAGLDLAVRKVRPGVCIYGVLCESLISKVLLWKYINMSGTAVTINNTNFDDGIDDIDDDTWHKDH